MRTLARIGIALAVGMLADSWPTRADQADDAHVRKSVVKVLVTGSRPDPFHPWARSQPQEATASGVVIAGRRILTVSHMINHASQVYVQADKSGEKLAAKVVARAPGIDLAVLKLDDDAFFDAHPPLPSNPKLPDLKQTVFAYGFPTGGSELSITRGIVSRVEYTEYYLSVQGLRVQVDAAINPGNSGGPAAVDGRLVGLVRSRLQQADNIGYLIPTEEIDLFLKDIEDGRYDGKPVLDVYVQKIESEALRARYKLDKKTTGVLIRKVNVADASYPLRVGDVLTRIGDQVIDNAGMVRIEGNRRVIWDVLVQRLVRAGRLPVAVVSATARKSSSTCRSPPPCPGSSPMRSRSPSRISSSARCPSPRRPRITWRIWSGCMRPPARAAMTTTRTPARRTAILGPPVPGQPAVLALRRLAGVPRRAGRDRPAADLRPQAEQGLR